MSPPLLTRFETRGLRWTVSLASGNDLEQQASAQLQRLLGSHNPNRWVNTTSIRIDSSARVPHSHPILTLNAAYLDRDDLAFANFLHEQIHWFAETRKLAIRAAIEKLRRIYPHVPSSPPEGARDENSTYLHLIVNWLEFEALRELLGEEPARRTIEYWSTHHYTWIYGRVLEDGPKIAGVVRRHNLLP